MYTVLLVIEIYLPMKFDVATNLVLKLEIILILLTIDIDGNTYSTYRGCS